MKKKKIHQRKTCRFYLQEMIWDWWELSEKSGKTKRAYIIFQEDEFFVTRFSRLEIYEILCYMVDDKILSESYGVYRFYGNKVMS